MVNIEQNLNWNTQMRTFIYPDFYTLIKSSMWYESFHVWKRKVHMLQFDAERHNT